MTQTRKELLKEELARLKSEFAQMVAQYAVSNPTMTYADIGKRIGISSAEVAICCKAHGEPRGRGGASTAAAKKVVTHEQ